MNNRETLYCFLKIVIPAVAIEIGAFILFLILKWCANKFISIPREYAKLKNKFDEEEESICTDINIAIENAKAKLPSCSDELQRVCINALTDNYRGIELNNFYQEKLSELNQQDISDSIPLQNLVQYIEDKTLNIGQQYQVVVYDIEDLISGKLASAYTEFLDKYETLLTSKQIVQGNHCINFNRWCFYNVYYKGRAIPSFNIESTISGVVFVLPTCFLLYTYNGNIEFIPFLSSYIAPSIDFAISKFKTLYSLDFPDSKVVGETWEHINKDGSPDKRYSENSHYFMVEIANIYLNIKGKTTYGFSNVNFARDFASAFRYLRDTLIESNITALKDVKLAPKEVKPGNEDKDAKPDTSLRVTKTSKHQVGDKHPSKPWVWTEYAPGKFDWRKDKLVHPRFRVMRLSCSANSRSLKYSSSL
jgi:hypothetical protein